MISVVETQLALALGIATDWPVRWSNGAWPSGTLVSDGEMPVDTDGAPLACMEAEIIGGPDTATIAPAASRIARRSGLFRVYLSVGQGTGTTDINTECDALVTAFKRQTIYLAASPYRRLITMDPRIDDGVASYEDGNRYCRMVSIPWDFEYVG